jgi:uncharacterized protein YbjT (DUF2867 family)
MYVITGATGNTGSVVAKRLLAQGKKVRAIGRSAERLQPLVNAGAEAYVADLGDSGALSKAFAGAEAVYVLIPPDLSTKDPLTDRARITDSIATALEKAQVKYVVSLSSIGAEQSEKVGPVFGLHRLEQKLNVIPGLNVLHLRAGYFMENTLAQVGTIHAMGTAAGPLRGDLKLSLIATQDIGEAAAAALKKLDFSDRQTRELQGQRDISMNEVAAIIGAAIGQRDLRYLHLPDEQVRPVLTQLGMSPTGADLLLEMAAALNSGLMRPLERRSPQNTTPTSYETFVAKVFVPAYKGKGKAA